MTREQARRQVGRVMELFPGATPEHGLIILPWFERYDEDVVHVGITRYAERNEFLNVAGLFAMVENEIRSRRGDENAERRRRERDEHERDLRAGDEVLAGMTDDELQAEKTAIVTSEPVAGWPQRMRQKLEAGDPRTHPLLRSLIIQRLGALTCA